MMMTLKLCQGLAWSSQERELLVIEIPFSVTVAPHPKLISAPRRQLAYLQPKNTFPVCCSVLVTPEARLSAQAFSCADARFQR